MPTPPAPTAPSGGTTRSMGRAAWSAGGAILAATVVALRSEGRRWWCAAGDLGPVVLGIRGEHNSQHALDPYSLTHALHGVLLYAGLRLVGSRVRWDFRLIAALELESGWEVIENSAWVIDRYRVGTIAQGYVGDSVLNSLGDIAACGLGFWLAGRLPVRGSVALFLAVEVALLANYRDNLLLNVLMLIHSSDAIKAWQGGG